MIMTMINLDDDDDNNDHDLLMQIYPLFSVCDSERSTTYLLKVYYYIQHILDSHAIRT